MIECKEKCNYNNKSKTAIKNDFVLNVENQIDKINNIMDSRHKTLELINLLEKDYFVDDVISLLNILNKNYLGFSDWYIPFSKELIGYRNEIIDDLLTALNLLRNSQGALVDDKYLEKFISFIDTCNNKYIKM